MLLLFLASKERKKMSKTKKIFLGLFVLAMVLTSASIFLVTGKNASPAETVLIFWSVVAWIATIVGGLAALDDE